MRIAFFLLSGLAMSIGAAIAAEVPPAFDEDQTSRLTAGECLVLKRRPGEGDPVDERFVTTARLIKGSRERIWEVINDKDNAADFVEGVLESRVLERDGNRLLVEQRTHVGGPKGDYRYRLRHVLTPMSRAEFTYEGGELEDVIGSWSIFDGPTPDHCLVIYSLHIHAGLFAPQPIVKAGMKKSMPRTMAAIAREVSRRESGR